MKIELYIDNSLTKFENLKELREYLSMHDTIPQVTTLIVDGRSISYFQICYFIRYGLLPC